ncbi:XrtA/PEP-CTERM system TPR-repeat protein PrsT [Candidatus Methylocalor cossyra]|uniref:PEP-CTERM system TPR-repeat lipoprotein n=1 Tax=Candidatus Methylocalor cossyra TaxID=3108543 RepID=A0ABM9NEV5_9GAMM
MNKRLCALALLTAFTGFDGARGAGDSALEAAKKYLGKGEYKAAVIELKNALQEDPENVEARLLIGEAYLKLADGGAAARAFEKARELKAPKDAWLLPLAQAYLLQHDPKSILDQIKPDPDLPARLRAQLYGIRGVAYLEQHDTAKAQESFDAALKLDPSAAEALLGLASLAAQERQFKKAIDYAQQVLRQDDRNANGWAVLGEAKRLDNDLPGAIEAFSKALQLQPNDLRARLGRATSYLSANQVAEAAKDVAEVRKVAGDLPLALYLQAVIEYQHKNLEAADDLLIRATNAMPDHLPSKLLLGTVAYQQGKYETAEYQLTQFLTRVPKYLPAAKLLAATRMKLGRPAEAIQTLKEVEDQAENDVQFLSLMGSAYLETKQFDLGNEYLNRAVELDPKAAALKAQLALGQMATGHLDQAVSDLKAAVELDQNLLQADVMLVLALIQQKKFDEAIDAANKLKAKMKNDPLPENILGAAYMAKGDADKAADHWNAALKLKPDYATAALNLAKLELRGHRLDGAVRYYERILGWDPKNLQALLGLAQVAELRKDFGAMEKYLNQARDKNPKALQPPLFLTRFYLQRGKPLQALEMARSAADANPDNPAALENLAAAQLANDQAASAVATLRRLVGKLPGEPHHRHQLAQALYKAGDKSAAHQEWRGIVKDRPDFLPAYLALAELEAQDKKFAEALKLVEQAKTRDPKSPLPWQLEGDIQLADKQYKKATLAYTKAQALAPSGLVARRLYQASRADGNDAAAFDILEQWLKAHGDDGESWAVLALGYQSVGKNAQALAAYEKAYALMPDNPLVQNNLAWLYQEMGDQRALGLADKLLGASENHPEIMDTVGWIYVQNGRLDKGLQLLQDAAVHAPQLLQIRFHVAGALAKAGRKEEARKELDALLKDNKDFPERRQAEALRQSL